MKFVWPPIAKALDERAAKIAEGLAAAERGKSDFEQAEKKVAELMAEGRNQVTEMVANAEKRAAKIVEEAKEQASHEAARIAAKQKLMWSKKLTVRAKYCANRLLHWLLKVRNLSCVKKLMLPNMQICSVP